MKNNGFTLIELLAVIVILAIIALIATPIILGIINDARDSAKTRSAELIATGVEYAITTYMYKNNGDVPKNISDFDEFFKVENFNMDSTGNVRKGTDIEGDAFCTVTKGTNKYTVECPGAPKYTGKDIAVGTL